MTRARIVSIVGLLMMIGLVSPVAVAQAVPAAAPAPLRSGTEIRVQDSILTDSVCTLGVIVSPTRALTAAHCGLAGQAVYNKSGKRIGTITANLIRRKVDIAVISLAPGQRPQVDAVAWNATLTKGQPISKSGVTTGLTRGTIIDPRLTSRNAIGFKFAPPFLVEHVTKSVKARLKSDEGDSGSGIRDAGGRVVGILSAGASATDTVFAPLSLVPGNLR